MVTDTISDMLTRIRNANQVKHQIVQIPGTKMSVAIASILKEEGFIEDFEIYYEGLFKYILISLKYKGKRNTPVISKLERISKPGLRVYSDSKNLPKVLENSYKGITKLDNRYKTIRFKFIDFSNKSFNNCLQNFC